MEKTLTLSEVKNLLIGKYLHVEGEYTIWEGVIHTVTKENIYTVRFGACYAVALSDADVIRLQTTGQTGSTYLFNDREDCLNKIRRMRELVSAQSAHTTNDVWQQRWWDVFLAYCSKEGISFKQGAILANEAIKTAMQEMDNFFNTK